MKASVIKEKASKRRKDQIRAKSGSETKTNVRRKSIEMRSINSSTVESNSNSSSNSSSCATSSGAGGEHGTDGLLGSGGAGGRWEEGTAKDRGKNNECQKERTQ